MKLIKYQRDWIPTLHVGQLVVLSVAKLLVVVLLVLGYNNEALVPYKLFRLSLDELAFPYLIDRKSVSACRQGDSLMALLPEEDSAVDSMRSPVYDTATTLEHELSRYGINVLERQVIASQVQQEGETRTAFVRRVAQALDAERIRQHALRTRFESASARCAHALDSVQTLRIKVLDRRRVMARNNHELLNSFARKTSITLALLLLVSLFADYWWWFGSKAKAQ